MNRGKLGFILLPMTRCHAIPRLFLGARANFWRGAVVAMVFGLCAGCMSSGPAITDSARTGPFFKPRNFTGDPVLPANLRRVLVLPVYGGTVAEPESTAALDDIVRSALQKQARFEVVQLTREDCRRRFGTPEISSVEALPHGFLEDLGRAFSADAVLFVDLTEYQPYRPLSVGFRAKLATVQEVRLVWSFDETFSARDPAVKNSVRHHSIPDSPAGPSVDQTSAALESPSRFTTYAAETMFSTLPPR